MKDNKKRPHTDALARYLRRDYILSALIWGSFLDLAHIMICLHLQEFSVLFGFFPMIIALIIAIMNCNGAVNRLRLEAWRQEVLARGCSFEEEKFIPIAGCTGLYLSEHWLQYVDKRHLQLYYRHDIKTVQASGKKVLMVTLSNSTGPQILYVRHGDAQIVGGLLMQWLQNKKMQDGRICPACGYVNGMNDRYCGHCGEALEEWEHVPD